MKTLVTAGTVYGLLDDNKLVGNRVRGIWAAKFAEYLCREKGWPVMLLVADTQEREIRRMVEHPEKGLPPGLEFVTQRGFYNYRDKVMWALRDQGCQAAVLAAAVVNWIPEKPFEGKMPTVGVGDRMNVPFILAPRVIDEVKSAYPTTTLIGCKMTIGETHEGLIHAAYKTLLGAKCNAVVANDMKTGLRAKTIVYQDRTEQAFDVGDEGFFKALHAVIADQHYWTSNLGQLVSVKADVANTFNRFVARYRTRFSKRLPDGHFVFGALGVPYNGPEAPEDLRQEILFSPREKGELFDSRSAVLVASIDHAERKVETFGGKATLNAPLLSRHLRKYPKAHGVLHLHEQLPGVPTVPYAPPGTVRDSYREAPGPVYNIEGHGFIACLDANGEIWK